MRKREMEWFEMCFRSLDQIDIFDTPSAPPIPAHRSPQREKLKGKIALSNNTPT